MFRALPKLRLREVPSSIAALVRATVDDIVTTERPEMFRGERGRDGERGNDGKDAPTNLTAARFGDDPEDTVLYVKDSDGKLSSRDLLGLRGRRGRKGATGLTGADGVAGVGGADGRRGDTGPKGDKGEPGKDGLPPAHEWVGTKLRFRQPNGVWGNSVNLKGDTGGRGASGSAAASGGGNMANVQQQVDRARTLRYFLGE